MQGAPSEVLWIGYPPSLRMDEQRLYNALILFGEIESITSFPLRNYTLVQFRSPGEAALAKDRLHGRLFNDPRILISFFSHTPTYNFRPPPPSNIQPLTEIHHRIPFPTKPENLPSNNPHPYITVFREDRDPHCCWEGIIAKMGIPVCRVRCLKVGGGLDELLPPQVLNFCARTEIDMLARHFPKATDFGVVAFVPAGEEEVESYQELVNFLFSHHRASVAKFSDGTKLFLVPQSEFTYQVLKLTATDHRLFGVLLRFSQQPPLSNQNPNEHHFDFALRSPPVDTIQGSSAEIANQMSGLQQSSAVNMCYYNFNNNNH